MMLGAGYSTVEKLVLSFSVSQANVFGSGKFISAQVNTGKVNRTYALGYMNPYFTVDGVSQGFDVYLRTTDAGSLSIGNYKTQTLGGNVKFGYPLSETDGVQFSFGGERVDLELFANSPQVYKDFVRDFGATYTYGAGTVAWGRDSRDSSIVPTSGLLAKAGAEVAGGDLAYYRLSAGGTWYLPLSRTFTFALNADLGYVHGLADKPVPFFKNFTAGGPGSLRGFKAFSLGPQDAFGNVLGGTRKVSGGAELLFPVPGAGRDKTMRLSTFLDTGQVWGESEKASLSDLRYSVGVALSWNSPFGPLKISVAQPLNAKDGFDRVERVQFTFGTAF
jgi:outer membrane protein insertion porin family